MADDTIIDYQDHRPKDANGNVLLNHPDPGQWYRNNLVLSPYEDINSRILTDRTKLGGSVSVSEASENSDVRNKIYRVLNAKYPELYKGWRTFDASFGREEQMVQAAIAWAQDQAQRQSLSAADAQILIANAETKIRSEAEEARLRFVESLKDANPITTGARYARDVVFQLTRVSAAENNWGSLDLIPSFDPRHVGNPVSKAAHWGLWGARGVWGGTKIVVPAIGAAAAWLALGSLSNAKKLNEKRMQGSFKWMGPAITRLGGLGTGIIAGVAGANAGATPLGIAVEGVYAGLFAMSALSVPVGVLQGKGRKVFWGAVGATALYIGSPFVASVLIDNNQVSPDDPVINLTRSVITPFHMQNLIHKQAPDHAITLSQISPFGALNDNSYDTHKPIAESKADPYANVTPRSPLLVKSRGYMPVYEKPVFSETDNSPDFVKAGDVRCIIGYDTNTDTVEIVSLLRNGKGFDPTSNFAPYLDQSPAAIEKYCGPQETTQATPSIVSSQTSLEVAPVPHPYPIVPDAPTRKSSASVKSLAPVLK